MNGEPIVFESSIAARTPAGDVLIALFDGDGNGAVILVGSVDAALSLIENVAASLHGDNGSREPDER
jgi:hypothetical protein